MNDVAMAGYRERDWAQLHDVSTDAGELARIAGSRPEFAAQIAAHPNAYPQLIEWAASRSITPETGKAEVPAVSRDRATGHESSANEFASASEPARPRARAPRIIVLGLFAVGLPLVAVMSNLSSSWTEDGNTFALVWAIAELVPYVALLIVCLLAAPTIGRGIGSAAFAFFALVVAVATSSIPYFLFDDGGYFGDFYFSGWGGAPAAVAGLVIAPLAFAAWAIAASLRGAAFAAIGLLIPVTLIWRYVESIVMYALRTSLGSVPLLAAIVGALLPALFLVIVVWCASAWSRASERSAARPPSASPSVVGAGYGWPYPVVSSAGGQYGPPALASNFPVGYGQPYGAYGSYGPGGYGAPRVHGTNTMAVLSLIFAFFFSLLAVIFGHVALGQIRRTGEQGTGMAVVGLLLGYIGLIAGIALGIYVIVAGMSAAHGFSSY
jgi:Domain of unknown function (DUF4190)